MAGGLAHLLEESGIQILVLLSLTFQVFLLVFAGIHRRKAPALTRLLIWLMYLLADSTAIYALGHLSLTSRSREHGLMAFWAPFLLVHLATNSGILVLIASILMFIVGVQKYARGYGRSGVATLAASGAQSNFGWSFKRYTAAHNHFIVCQSIFADFSGQPKVPYYNETHPHIDHTETDVYNVVEMELSLMYDILYTKAEAIHTRLGYCIRVVSLLATITACKSLRDSGLIYYLRGSMKRGRLWLRHLLTFLVQVVGVAYAIFRYTADSGTLVLIASTLMFIVGVLKYAERIWALRCGNMSSIRSRVQFWMEFTRYAAGKRQKCPSPYDHDLGADDNGDEEFLLEAHHHFIVCQSIFADFSSHPKDQCYHETPLRADDRKIDVYKVVEMELSLMYDILYTKAGAIHTRLGYCIRVVSLLATTISVGLFQSSNGHGGYSRADVAITYVLLIGALVLEIISTSRAIVSTWTCAWMLKMERKPVLKGLKCLRRFCQTARKRRLSSSIGQYNMLHLCTRDTNELGSRLALKMGVEDWWNRLHFVGTIDISKTDLPVLLLEALPKLDVMNSGGLHILESRGLLHHDSGTWCRWSMNIDFDQSILIWHTATDIYLSESRYKYKYDSMDHHAGKVAEAVKVLSNYMLFLLVAKPDLVPGPIRPTKYVRTGVLVSVDNRRRLYPGVIFGDHVGVTIGPISWSMVKKLFRKDGPNGNPSSSRIQEREKFAGAMLNTFCHSVKLTTGLELMPPDRITNPTHSYREYGSPLANELLKMEKRRPDLLQAIFEVWLEMLCYAANHCSGDSHARQLSSGGEFITVVWLLTRQIRDRNRT